MWHLEQCFLFVLSIVRDGTDKEERALAFFVAVLLCG